MNIQINRCFQLTFGSAQVAIMFMSTIAFLCVVCVARCLHRRFYIWQEEKYRSRVAMSVSGQSFLSSADSLHTTGLSNSQSVSQSSYNHLRE